MACPACLVALAADPPADEPLDQGARDTQKSLLALGAGVVFGYFAFEMFVRGKSLRRSWEELL